MEGLHLTADCFECQGNELLLTNYQHFAPLLHKITLDAGLTIVGDTFFPFVHANGKAAGFTGTLLLAESHIAIHTWPEKNAVTLDVYVCNFENDNSDKARTILDSIIHLLQPERALRQELLRGVPSEVHLEKLTERLSPFTSMQTVATQNLAAKQSQFQHIEIADTPDFGKIMRIDGALMTSEKDEFFYHEALVHPAALSLGGPESALIIGGGDGGSTEELLKYGSIKSITLCEIDPEVITLARQHLRSIHQDAFEDKRVSIEHRDGFAFIEECTQKFDLILLDLTDPIAPNGSNLAESCLSKNFFDACYKKLNDTGALVLHLGSRFYHQSRYNSSLEKLNASFDLVRPYSVFIPLYGALWGMAIALKLGHEAKLQDPMNMSEGEVDQAIQQHQLQALQYYSAQTHVAMFRI
jgi:spermidine synthase